MNVCTYSICTHAAHLHVITVPTHRALLDGAYEHIKAFSYTPPQYQGERSTECLPNAMFVITIPVYRETLARVLIWLFGEIFKLKICQ